MKKLFRSAILMVMAFVLLAQSALAATPTDIRITHVEQNDKELKLYITSFTAMEDAADLEYTADSYELRLNGDEEFKASKAASITANRSKIHYIVCADISKSIGSSNYGGDSSEPQVMRDALKYFARDLKSNEVMTLLTFGDEVKVLQSAKGSDDLDALYASIDGIKPTDNYTALYEAVYRGVLEAEKYEKKYDYSVVILLTDGTDEPTSQSASGTMTYDWDKVLEQLRNSSIPVYTVAFLHKDTSSHKQTEEIKTSQELSDASGGILLKRDVSKFSDGLNSIREITRKAAVVTVPLTNTKHPEKSNMEQLVGVYMKARGEVLSPTYAYPVDWRLIPLPTATPSPEPSPITPTPAPPTSTPSPSPTPDNKLDKLEFLQSSYSEDDPVIEVMAELGTSIRITLNGKPVSEDGAKVNAQGIYTWTPTEPLRKGDKIVVMGTDEARNTDKIDTIIQESGRKKIEVSVSGYDSKENVVNAKTLTISGSAEPNTELLIKWHSMEDGQDYSFPATVDSSGVFFQTITKEQAATGDGSLSVVYNDGIGSTLGFSISQMNWDDVLDKGVDPTTIEPLTEDSSTIIVHTEPNSYAEVSKKDKSNNTIPFARGSGTVPADGTFSFDIDSSNSAEPLQVGDVITVFVKDPADNTQNFIFDKPDERVAESPREKITVNVDHIDEDGVLMDDKLVVWGQAEPGEKLVVHWLLNDDPNGRYDQPIPVDDGGNYKTTIDQKIAPEGEGKVYVEYADGLGHSKASYYSVRGGTIVWATPTPEPTERVTPTPVPTQDTPTPTATVTTTPTVPVDTPTPTVEPEPEPDPTEKTIIEKAKDWLGGDDMLHTPKFWFLVAAALILIALIVLLIVLLVKRDKKKNAIRPAEIIGNDDQEREDGNRRATVRESEEPRAGGTQRTSSAEGPKPIASGSTSGGTQRLGASAPVGEATGSAPKGTVRIAPQPTGGGGTVRIAKNDGPAPIALTIEETSQNGETRQLGQGAHHWPWREVQRGDSGRDGLHPSPEDHPRRQ